MASSNSLQIVTEAFAQEGELLLPKINEAFLISGEDKVWFLESGQIEMFAVQNDMRSSTGPRTHFLTLEPGAIFFGMDFDLYGQGSGFMVTCAEGTHICRLSRKRLENLALQENYSSAIGELIDDWLLNTSASVAKDIRPKPKPDELLVGGQEVRLPRASVARAKKGIVWIQMARGEALYLGIEGARVTGVGAPILPISPDTWIEATNDNVLNSLSTSKIIPDQKFWRGIDSFHETLCHCEFINKNLRMVDEFNRVQLREAFGHRSRAVALRDIASVLDRKNRNDSGDLSGDLSDAMLAACNLVGAASGIKIMTPPDLHRSKEKILSIAKASRCRIRSVALRDNWWETDHGPLLAYREQTLDPVAILKTASTKYELVDPQTREQTLVDEKVASTLRPFAISFYAPLPAKKLNAWELIKFGVRDSKKDLWMILGTGILVGLLGMVTPYFSGQIFDTIIPSADRGQLFQFTIGLIAAALGTFAFELVKAISVLRLEGQMDYSVQAGIMDRLLDLPSTFFREYTSGDLADRALGIDQIRQAISQAGTQAIVGTISASIMVLFLFAYNTQMAIIALLLLAISVLFPFGFNVLQLKYQRSLFYIRGNISGLVLQLINGVNKLRVSGSEDRAFREWARKFAQQKRIAYKAGKIANCVQVFNQVFPILSTAILFGFYAYFQQQAQLSGERFKMTTGDFVALSAIFMNILSAMLQLSGASLELMIIFPLAERLKPIIETPPEIDEAKAHPGDLSGEIEVRHVTFRYLKDGPAILKDLSLRIRAGEYVALVGGSGSGKSTLLRLLLGFEKPESGSIFYDGYDLNSVDIREVRQQLGVVLQSSKLMPTDIYRNIIGSRNLTVNDAWEAARMAGLDRDIKNMPMGMHTVVSEGGGTFSGGQRQRLMIARALVNKPRIIFFDEATSALDNETQRIVTQSMDSMQATRIVIAHRLSTIINADRIFVLHFGELVQSGSYDELMNQTGPFVELARRQLA
jgi:NHLM bacteriocin system ABC transporter ATP-binding protein